MSSGKSEYMRNKLMRRVVSGKYVQLFQPVASIRESDPKKIEKRGYGLIMEPLAAPSQLYDMLNQDTEVIGLDEVHFCDKSIINIIKNLVDSGKEVFACSLELNFRAEPVRLGNDSITIYNLMPIADNVKIINSICTYENQGKICGCREARWVQKYYGDKAAPSDSPLIEKGDVKPCDGVWYAPRCREHYHFYGE